MEGNTKKRKLSEVLKAYAKQQLNLGKLGRATSLKTLKKQPKSGYLNQSNMVIFEEMERRNVVQPKHQVNATVGLMMKPKSTRRTQILTLARKKCILDFRTGWLAERQSIVDRNLRDDKRSSTYYDSDQHSVLRSTMFTKALCTHLMSQDKNVSKDDVRRWINTHEWITRATMMPPNWKPITNKKKPKPKGLGQPRSSSSNGSLFSVIQPHPRVPIPRTSTSDIPMPILTPQVSRNSLHCKQKGSKASVSVQLFSPAKATNNLPLQPNNLPQDDGGTSASSQQTGSQENSTKNLPTVEVTPSLPPRKRLSARMTPVDNEAETTLTNPGNDILVQNDNEVDTTPKVPTPYPTLPPPAHVPPQESSQVPPFPRTLFLKPSPLLLNEIPEVPSLRGVELESPPPVAPFQALQQGSSQVPRFQGPHHTLPFQSPPQVPPSQAPARTPGNFIPSPSPLKTAFMKLVTNAKEHGFICQNSWNCKYTKRSRLHLDPPTQKLKVNIMLSALRRVCEKYGDGLFDVARMVALIDRCNKVFDRIMKKFMFPVGYKELRKQVKQEHIMFTRGGDSEDDQDDESKFTQTIIIDGNGVLPQGGA